jgi:hypothetical protein
MCWKKKKRAEAGDRKHYAFSKCWQNRVLAIYIYIFGCTLYFDRQKVNTLRVACSCALYFLYENLHHLPKIGWMMLIKGVHGNHIVLQLIFWFRRKVSLMRMKSSLNRKDFLKMMLKLNPKMDKVTSMLLL